MEPLSVTLIVFGIAILAISWGLLIIEASGDDFTWALSAVFLPPLAYFYGLWRWHLAGDSIKLAIIGLVLIWIAL